MMVKVTYLGLKKDGYVVGSCASMREAVKESVYKKGFDVFYFVGDVERLIRNTGLKKVYDLVSIVRGVEDG